MTRKVKARRKIFLLITGCMVAGLIAGYFIANAVVRGKVDAALKGLPPSIRVRYRSLHADILTGSIDVGGIVASYEPSGAGSHSVSVKKLAVGGISFVQWVANHRLRVRNIRADGVMVRADDDLLEKDSTWKSWQAPAIDALLERLEIDSLNIEGTRSGVRELTFRGAIRLDSLTPRGFGGLRVEAADAAYNPAGIDETVRLRRLVLDSKERLLTLDTLKISPDRDKEEIGRSRGHQVDVVRATIEGVRVVDLDVMGVFHHRLQAGQIDWNTSRIYVFRDRRLPLEEGDKPMPMAGLERLPLDLRVGKVNMGTTRFEYEEYPKAGQKTGVLTIEHLRGTMEPLLNKPGKGDPSFITVRTEGSLMGSGLVTATTRMPLHKNGYYEVEGAFHNLDITRLNDPAENLGQLHLESGMLNQLNFQFEMGPERSTGKIVGEYHDLVVDKLKEKNGRLKVARLKSFALKKFIIPRNKDKSLAVSKRTGKVDYKRDKERYFSYYLLHSLLVGVKSSFSLGFLLPG